MKSAFSIKRFLVDNSVVILFVGLTVALLPMAMYGPSGMQPLYIIQELLTRLGRDAFIVLALLIPIYAGMGLNFGMTLGAMAAQVGLIFAVDWGIGGVQGLVFATLIGLPISIALGWMTGSIMNRAKGREMITGYILSFFMTGVYWFFVQIAMGNFIPMRNSAITLLGGGVRNTVSLNIMAGSLDKLIDVRLFGLEFPIANYLMILALCLFIVWFKRTKLGQDMRAVGNDLHVASSAGIKVDRTRTISIVISTVLACIGQVMFLQNINNMATYNAHDNTSLFAIAALLVGGASAKRASLGNVFLGFVIFHMLYIVAPEASQRFSTEAQLGTFARQFISYFIIALSLALYAWRERSKQEASRDLLRVGVVPANGGPK